MTKTKIHKKKKMIEFENVELLIYGENAKLSASLPRSEQVVINPPVRDISMRVLLAKEKHESRGDYRGRG